MKKKLVVLTGAGISAESGLKTFRNHDGLWENFKIEDVATPEAWKKNPEMVLRFYNERRQNVLSAQPNAAHLTLADLEHHFDIQIITQNIDDLHERAGSKNVLHLHGEILKMRSERNAQLITGIRKAIQLGDLAKDGAQYRPHIVWFGEEVPMLELAIPSLMEADYFVLIGSSLAVYPAAGLLQFVPDQAPKYILDPNIPKITYKNALYIEKQATIGIEELKIKLLAAIDDNNKKT